ncbi:MAG: signal peptidase I [Lachnospiraceae bacterium]|jgi:signal peptidase I|nr:signal peptidase I [Lachnospiraceae bacterium]MDE6991274.1 signal peptidase I [Lachnospiraceae bacterium]MDE7002096.1 signal peptidase I [Lachnospiraceae bacterium]
MAGRKGLTFYQKKKKLNIVVVKEVFSWFFWIFASMLLAVVMVFCIGMQTSVIGPSMEPSLYNGQKIFLNRLIYKVASPRVGDVIVFLPNGNEKSHYYVKRVVGVPGDTLYIKNGLLYVNEETVEEYFNDRIAEPGLLESEVTLGEDEYFVIGDNCNNSEDSRSANIGSVRKSYIIGKAWMKLAAGDSELGLIE